VYNNRCDLSPDFYRMTIWL